MKKSKKEINRCALIFFLLFFLCEWFAAIIKVGILLRHFHVIMVLLNVCGQSGNGSAGGRIR